MMSDLTALDSTLNSTITDTTFEAGARCPKGMRKSRAGCISKGSRSPGARTYRKSAGKVYGRPKFSPSKKEKLAKLRLQKSPKKNTLSAEDAKKKEQYLCETHSER